MKMVIIVFGLLLALVIARSAISDDTIIIYNNPYPYTYSPYGGQSYIYVIPNEGNLYVEPTPFGRLWLKPPPYVIKSYNIERYRYQKYCSQNYGICE